MSIVVDVNLLYKNALKYIEVIVDKYPSLISYHGKYFYRSGSTMRTITGKELNKTILKLQSRTWYANSGADLKYQDEVHGSLIEQADKVVDLVYTNI